MFLEQASQREKTDMVVEESSKRGSKLLYKIELYMLKIMPMLLAAIYLVYTILSYFDIDLPILSYIGGMSLIPIVFMYLSSYVFKFCSYHRMFLHYIVVLTIISTIDLYIGIPVDDFILLIINMIIAGIFLFIILYLYVKSNSKTVKKNSR